MNAKLMEYVHARSIGDGKEAWQSSRVDRPPKVLCYAAL